jgi:hypothetical protein
MSLISGANFVAPLRSKVQVVGIFALAVLVAVLRLVDSGDHDSEGASSRHRTVSSAGGSETSLAEDLDAYNALRHKTRSVKPSGGSAGDAEVDEILQGVDSRASSGRKQAQESVDNSSEPPNLSDIVRRLERGGE